MLGLCIQKLGCLWLVRLFTCVIQAGQNQQHFLCSPYFFWFFCADFIIASFGFTESKSLNSSTLENFSPVQIIEVVCCKLTPLQSELYNHFIDSKNVGSHSFYLSLSSVQLQLLVIHNKIVWQVKVAILLPSKTG